MVRSLAAVSQIREVDLVSKASDEKSEENLSKSLILGCQAILAVHFETGTFKSWKWSYPFQGSQDASRDTAVPIASGSN